MMRLPLHFLGLSLTFACVYTPAQALTIGNQDIKPHEISIQFAQTEPQIITLNPGGYYRTKGPELKLQHLSKEFGPSRIWHGRDRDHYAIYPNGKFGIRWRGASGRR